ncbi:branched-chain amino acid aminotransferase [Thermodesulforhabdus norvegica]|uniref:Branched-chain-amino-acid aminotransferase n=1 Tax=Thermodesulforhabdus norvegica TaxID=39841 RepID=A0A1I4TQX9_9BACT|nr:branched-chain amino acid aminotransferase [Thermodesulforhabdus norvegica]SFM78943.1 branched chain amino acid aminotransferase apoenzyme [Thermodesulforhabdus norvegica]
MEIKVMPAGESERRPKPKDESKLVFGTVFSDHMFIMNYDEGRGWHDARIVPYQNLSLDPAAMVLHYGQGIFEGLKAYRASDGRILLFRPEKNWERFNKSARRMCMPEIDPAVLMQSLEALLRLDADWVPRSRGTSLYIRPTMFATEPALGVRPAKQYVYYVITGPVGPYYPEGFNPVKIYVSDEYVRAVRGGVGEAKTMGNYAASLYAAEIAKKKGYTQVLWLDAVERRYVEEVGTMNIFFRIEDTLVTPPLTGSILPGVTRESVIHLARHWGIKVEERPITIDEVIERAKDGSLKECFGTGTAAVISPVSELCYKEERVTIADGSVGEWSRKLYDELVGIQYGEKEDIFGWVREVPLDK